MYDYHIHSEVSGDALEKMEAICEAALKAGLKEICLTDHIDVDFPFGIDFIPDFAAYEEKYCSIRDKYPGLAVKKGLEAGLLPHVITQTNEALKNERFDFIIASQHVIRGEDPYSEKYFEGKTEKEAYMQYFDELFSCLKLFHNYNVIGHLGVPSRFSPYPVKPVAWADYAELIDGILKHLIQNGKGLEVNTTGCAATGEFLPSLSILRRYRELNGEILTVGSDAHAAERVGDGCMRAIGDLRELGFRYVCTFENMRPIFNKI